MRTSYISPISMGPHKMSRKIEGAKANLPPFSRGSHYGGKNGESIAEAHAELDGAPHHIYSF